MKVITQNSVYEVRAGKDGDIEVEKLDVAGDEVYRAPEARRSGVAMGRLFHGDNISIPIAGMMILTKDGNRVLRTSIVQRCEG